MRVDLRVLLIITTVIFLFGYSTYGCAQEADSTLTKFRKGRWQTGLAGSISTTRIQLNDESEEISTNNYGINIQTGKFLKDRWLVGGRFQINRVSSAGNVDQTTESLFIGPYSNYYLSDSPDGSIFGSLSFGYTRFKNNTIFESEQNLIEEISEGGGFGTIIGLGYSYTITNSVAFDLGINLNLFWVTVDQESAENQQDSKSTISSNDLSLSFGFNIILDKFFL